MSRRRAVPVFLSRSREIFTSAFVWDDPQGISLRAPVRDADAASRAVKGIVDLAKVAPFKEILRLGDVVSSTEELAGTGKVSLATFARAPTKDPRDERAPRTPSSPTRDGGASDGASLAKRPTKPPLGLAWLVDGGVLSMASGEVPLNMLGATVHPDRKLGDEPAVARSLTALGTSTSGVLLVQPLRFDAKRANLPAAPLVIALGRKDKDATLRIDVANGLLREVARWQMGL